MKSPFFTTAIMALLAAATMMVAAFFYPWPERVVESDLVGKPLFEEYDASAVRSISIAKYDADRNGMDRIDLRRSGEKWIVPAKKNFIATNAEQISRVVNSLNNLTVLENRSNAQQDHVDFGVVDPVEYESSTNRSSLGTKIVLEDRNKRELASLIVGSSLRNESSQQQLKHFVRIPGQPNVYVVEINPAELSTDFTRWVKANLLDLTSQTPVDSIEIKNYRMAPNQLQTAVRNWEYQATLDVKSKNFQLQVPQPGSATLVETEITPENIQQLNSLGTFLGNIRFTDVQRKSSAAAKILKKRVQQDDTSGALDSLQKFGFAKTGFDSGFQFNAVGGDVSVRTGEIVVFTILIGSLVDSVTAGDLTLNHYVMLYASVDESLLPAPEAPAANDDAEQADKGQKAYLREVEKRKEKIKAAKLRASEFNQSFADWYYIVSEDVITGLRPDLTIPAPVKSNETSSESNSLEGENGADESKSEDSDE
jgi:hypothetical protein